MDAYMDACIWLLMYGWICDEDGALARVRVGTGKYGCVGERRIGREETSRQGGYSLH